MRLFTFQNKAYLSVLDKGIWQSTRSRRLKCVDNDHADWDNDIYPIYTFASYGIKYNSCFGLHQLYSAYTTIFSFLDYELDNIVMVELEVPEDFILSLKELLFIEPLITHPLISLILLLVISADIVILLISCI